MKVKKYYIVERHTLVALEGEEGEFTDEAINEALPYAETASQIGNLQGWIYKGVDSEFWQDGDEEVFQYKVDDQDWQSYEVDPAQIKPIVRPL
jgi:hypothetical protein